MTQTQTRTTIRRALTAGGVGVGGTFHSWGPALKYAPPTEVPSFGVK